MSNIGKKAFVDNKKQDIEIDLLKQDVTVLQQNTSNLSIQPANILVASQSAMLALTDISPGQVVIREDDNNYQYYLKALPASNLSNWEVLGKDVPPVGETVEDVITTNEVITSKVDGLYAFTGTPNGGFPAGVTQGDIAQKTASVWTVVYTFINAPASIYSKSDGQTYDKKVNSSNVNNWIAKPKPTYYEIGSNKEYTAINAVFAQFIADARLVGTGQLYDSDINERVIFPANAQNFLLKGEGYVARNNNLVNNFEILGHRFTLQKCQPNSSGLNTTRTVTTTLNSKIIVITGTGQTTAGFVKYQKITGTGIPAMSYIDTIVNSTTFTINQNATANGTNIVTTIQPKAPVIVDSNGQIIEPGSGNTNKGKHGFDDVSFSTPGASAVDIFDVGNWVDFTKCNFDNKEINLYTTSTTPVFITFTSCQSGIINIYSPFIVVTKVYSPSVTIKTIINQAAIVDFDKVTPVAYSIIRQRSFGQAFDIPLGAMIVNDDFGAANTLQNMKCTTAYTVAFNPTTGTPIDITKYQVQTDNLKENAFTKNTAFNKNYSTTATDIKANGIQNVGTLDTLPRADHVHPTDTTREAVANKVSTFSATPNHTNFPTEKLIKDSLDLKLNTSLKGSINGVAELGSDGRVPSSQLPSFVNDVLEFANFSSFPATGETAKIYIAIDTNITYRWSGTIYVEISSSLALGETSATAYRGDRGKTAYDHSQISNGNPHGTTKTNIGLGNVDNTSDLNKPISTATQTALDLKENKVKQVKTFTNRQINFTITTSEIDAFDVFQFDQTTPGIIISLSSPTNNVSKIIEFLNLPTSEQAINLINNSCSILPQKKISATFNGANWNVSQIGESSPIIIDLIPLKETLNVNDVILIGDSENNFNIAKIEASSLQLSNNQALQNLIGESRISFVPYIDIEIEKYFSDFQTLYIKSFNCINSTNSTRIRFSFIDSNFQIIPTIFKYQGSYYADNLGTYGASVSSNSSYGILTDLNYAITLNKACFIKIEIQKTIEGINTYYNIRSNVDYYSTSNTNTTFINSTNANINSTQILKYIRIYSSTGDIKGDFDLLGEKKSAKYSSRYNTISTASVATVVGVEAVASTADIYQYISLTNK